MGRIRRSQIRQVDLTSELLRHRSKRILDIVLDDSRNIGSFVSMSDPIVFISHSKVKEGFEIYGAPNEETLAMLRQAPGVDVEVNPDGFGGYIRLGET